MQFRQQAQNFKIQPNKGHQQRHTGKPLHVFGCTIRRLFFNEIEIQDQIEGGNPCNQSRTNSCYNNNRKLEDTFKDLEYFLFHLQNVNADDYLCCIAFYQIIILRYFSSALHRHQQELEEREREERK